VKQFSYFLSGLSILLLVSCSTPRSILKLQPQSEQTSWFYGQEFTGDSIYGIIAKVAFDEVQHPWYVFDVDISNRSNMNLLVDPSQIFIAPFNAMKEPLDTIYAVNPESKIMEMDKNLSINAANQKNRVGMYLVAAGIDIATGIAVLSDDNPRNDELRTDLLPLAIAAGAETKFNAMDLNELRDTWKSTTLRKTTLEKGFAMHGRLMVPVSPNASYIQLNIPVDEKFIRINFMQLRFNP